MKIYQKSLAEMKEIVTNYNEETIDLAVETTVREIIQDVQKNGDQALRKYTQKFDGVALEKFEVSTQILKNAWENLDNQLKQALQIAYKNITSFHQQQLERGFVDASQPGILRGQKITPLKRVGLYIPGGTAAYPSSVLMNAIPAKIAGVKEIIMLSPTGKNGINKTVLAAAYLCGVNRVFQVGGAQGIAALAYGTQTIPRVDKIVGPGNIYVATAKKQVFGKVAIDMVAGPSEIGILADKKANVGYLAADLLSQAEHDKRARSILVTSSLSLAKKVSQEVDRQLLTLPRRKIAQEAIKNNSFIAVMPKVEEMFALMNLIAPEHLEIQLENPSQYLGMVQNAGSVFLGPYSSEPLGDYLAGPNHVLPTGATARFSSPLGVSDFTKRIQFLQYDQESLKKVGKKVVLLANEEGLQAHGKAISYRLEER